MSDTHATVRQRLAALPTCPGVYRMLDATGTVLYVGKAKQLKRRVASYFGRTLGPRHARLVSLIADIAVTVTRTEGEALLLESQLIKSLQPRFNVLLRDDKSYPYILLTTHDRYPRLALYRGSRQTARRLFGPYPSASAVRDTLQLLQKLFPVRQCEDAVFRHRSRPCLHYQMHRCTAPCVGLIAPEQYAADVARTVKFLNGQGTAVIDELIGLMETAATALEFERAAHIRDRIHTLRRVLERHALSGEAGDLDLIATAHAAGVWCVQIFMVRGGRHLGNTALFPTVPPEYDAAAVLAAVLAQFYTAHEIPETLIVSTPPDDAATLAAALSERAGHAVTIHSQTRGERARWLELAQDNARFALEQRLGSQAGYARRLEALRVALGLSTRPQRLECFDISHTQGERPVAACVVFDANGPRPTDYRRFNITDITPGDDYAALAQALTRRYHRIERGESPRPDIVFIDGGRGQLNAVAQALAALGLHEVSLIGIAKGPERCPGTERLWLLGQDVPVILPSDSPALHLIIQIRDEAHRFALTGHRQRRATARVTSALEGIAGLGPKRRQRLLQQFGGLRGVARAAVAELAAVAGISQPLAERIHAAFHRDQT